MEMNEGDEDEKEIEVKKMEKWKEKSYVGDPRVYFVSKYQKVNIKLINKV